MSHPIGITLDKKFYRVFVEYESLKRSFEIYEGENTGDSLSGRKIRDIIGTKYKYQMTVRANPEFPDDYDDFYEAISEPIDYHTVSLPYGQGLLTFDAYIESGDDTYEGVYNKYQRWDELELTFEAIKPQRT